MKSIRIALTGLDWSVAVVAKADDISNPGLFEPEALATLSTDIQLAIAKCIHHRKKQ